MANAEKCTEEIKVRIPERLLLDLAKLAEADDRTLGDFIRRVLTGYCYGHARTVTSDGDRG